MQEKEEEGRKRGGGGVFDFFQRYYKLSECSCIVIGNTGRTGKNSGGLVKFFTQQSCGPVAFSTKVFSTSIQCVINIHE